MTNRALERDGYICRFMVFTKNIGGLEENIDQWGDHAPYIFSISKHEYMRLYVPIGVKSKMSCSKEQFGDVLNFSLELETCFRRVKTRVVH